jgi:hypothetical protein
MMKTTHIMVVVVVGVCVAPPFLVCLVCVFQAAPHFCEPQLACLMP